MAEVAEKLASKSIVGSQQDVTYMNIVRYWSEDIATVAEELKNGLCAAFFTIAVKKPSLFFLLNGLRKMYALRELPRGIHGQGV